METAEKSNGIAGLGTGALLAFCLLMAAIGVRSAAARTSVPDPSPVEGFVYFADSSRISLRAVPVLLPAGIGDHELGRTLLARLLEGPSVSGVRAVFPNGTQVDALFITDQGEAYVNLAMGQEFLPEADAATEFLGVYSLVNTLTLNIPGIQRVKILVNGAEGRSLGGHISLAHFFQTNMLIVK